MTDLVAPGFMTCRSAVAAERWHGMVMRGNLIACIVVKQEPGGNWKVTAELKDLSLRRASEQWQAGSYESHSAAHEAGRRAVARLHEAIMIARECRPMTSMAFDSAVANVV